MSTQPPSLVPSPQGFPFTSNGRLLELVELSLDEAQHQAGLAHGHVAQQHQLELADLGLR